MSDKLQSQKKIILVFLMERPYCTTLQLFFEVSKRKHFRATLSELLSISRL